MIKTTAAAALAFAPAPALAQLHATPITARVSAGDLDLTAADGVRTLDRRLRAAVRLVCPDRLATELSRRMLHRACVKATTRSTAEQRDFALARAAAPVRLGAVAR